MPLSLCEHCLTFWNSKTFQAHLGPTFSSSGISHSLRSSSSWKWRMTFRSENLCARYANHYWTIIASRAYFTHISTYFYISIYLYLSLYTYSSIYFKNTQVHIYTSIFIPAPQDSFELSPFPRFPHSFFSAREKLAPIICTYLLIQSSLENKQISFRIVTHTCVKKKTAIQRSIFA